MCPAHTWGCHTVSKNLCPEALCSTKMTEAPCSTRMTERSTSTVYGRYYHCGLPDAPFASLEFVAVIDPVREPATAE